MPKTGSETNGKGPQEIQSPGLVRDSVIAEQINVPGKGYAFAIHELMANGSWQTREATSIDDAASSQKLVPSKQPPWPLSGRPAEYGNDLDLFKENKEFFAHHLDLRNKRCYDVMSSYVYVTERIEEFDTIAYLNFLGPKGRAKSRALELLALLCYRGWLITHPTPASVFWVVDRYCPTLLADNYEFWPRETRNELDGLFNAGYRRGAVVPRRPREGESGSELVLYKVFCPKGLAGTRAPVDSLGSRCVVIHMAKNRHPTPLGIDKSWAQQLRDKLLTYRFRHFEISRLRRP